ncbi:protein-export chaperone SecB [Burkholderia cenocepacia]|uniref:protein-export chaperone SecB n=1 Tax=Burkholderia cenocepacia TaxID=95486 RepID=UPI0007618654|nr:protein-export chaperone SecB [Burkholderia cenocepacia]KWU17848.1 hypothetical protein AS149_14100 [Burkholderia cenocepacia]
MQDKICNIAVQYVSHAYATAHVRPYDNKHPLAQAIEVELNVEPLADEGHFRLQLDVRVTGTNSENMVCFETGVSIEGIVVEKNLTDEERAQMLNKNMPGLLLGTARSVITTLSLQTGYGPIILPPLSGDQLFAMAQKSQISSEEAAE